MSPHFPPVPGPPLLLSHLLGLMFVLHVVFMNYLIAAPILAVWYRWLRPDEGRDFARWLTAALPVTFTFAINFGVACLLFVQVLHPDRFFTANILFGVAWLSVIVLLLLAFYGAYIHRRFARDDRPFWAGLAGLAVTACVWAMALVMIGNYFNATSKELWPVLQRAPWEIIKSQTLVPRLLHFISGAFAVTGFWMVWISWWRAKREASVQVVMSFRRHGLLVALGGTGLQVIVGVWLLIWLPSAAWDRLFSGSIPSLIWISAVASGLVMLGLLIVANVFPDRPIWQKVSTALLAWTLIGMTTGRDLVRIVAFGPDFSVKQLPWALQPGAMLAFGLILAAGALSLLWLFWLVRRLPASKPN